MLFNVWQCLPIEYYFSVDQVMGSTKQVDKYVSQLPATLRSAFRATQEVTQEEVAHQKRLYDRKASVVTLKVGDIMLVRTATLQGKRKIKDQWGDVTYRVVTQVDKVVPVYIFENQHGKGQTLHCN